MKPLTQAEIEKYERLAFAHNRRRIRTKLGVIGARRCMSAIFGEKHENQND